MPEILYEVSGRVATVTLNRPEKLNAWTRSMEQEVRNAMQEAARDESVRVIVMTGAGRGFCAGADMSLLSTVAASGPGEHPLPDSTATASDGSTGARPDFARQYSYFPAIPKPIIAAINGPCAGIGLVQALMCDLRFAAAEAKLTTAFARRGLVAEHGISWILPRLVGPARALDLLLSGRVVLGEEAAAMGLVNRALPAEQLLGETLAYARDMATNCSPASMAAMKRQVYADLERGASEALAEADRLMLASFDRDDFREGVASFVERREPRFAPLAG